MTSLGYGPQWSELGWRAKLRVALAVVLVFVGVRLAGVGRWFIARGAAVARPLVGDVSLDAFHEAEQKRHRKNLVRKFARLSRRRVRT